MHFTDLIRINSVSCLSWFWGLSCSSHYVCANQNPLSAASRCGDGNLVAPVLLCCEKSRASLDVGTWISLGWQALSHHLFGNSQEIMWMNSGKFLTLSHLYHNILYLWQPCVPDSAETSEGADTSTSPEPAEPLTSRGLQQDAHSQSPTDWKISSSCSQTCPCLCANN